MASPLMLDQVMQDQTTMQLPRHTKPFDWAKIQTDIHRIGGVIVEQLYDAGQVKRLNHDMDVFIEQNLQAGNPHSGSPQYDRFLGAQTIRLQGLINKSEEVAQWIGDPALVRWASSSLAPVATSILLNAAELIQIGPDEPAQYLHRDSDSWPTAVIQEDPFIVNSLVALDEFTLDNGATWLVPGSWTWPRDRRAEENEYVRAEMLPGDGLLFRGDILHRGGANFTSRPRRGISITYCAGWLRPVENSVFNIPIETVRSLTPKMRELLGFHAYDGSAHSGGMLGLYENGNPDVLL
jgi:ectoine hydroxylase-related dioxygenase (phytanoyl-CoA dioxygenase family)